LLTGAVGEVFFVRAAETGRGERLATLTAVTFRRLAALSLFPCLVVLVAGPALFAFVFGAEWRAAGVYAQVLAPWVLLTALSVPLTGLFDVLERQRADLVVAVALFAGQAAGLLLGGGLGGPLGAVIGVSAAGVGLRLLHLGWMLRMADAPLGRAALDLGGRLLLALPFLLPLLVAQALRAGGWVLLAAGGAGALGYYAVVGWRERG
ncbi:MAG: hypothetical protein R3362_09675, partial [Rhodothermales bacterium]|nr:hypothetical protein [Rhodothermales bacterium]